MPRRSAERTRQPKPVTVRVCSVLQTSPSPHPFLGASFLPGLRTSGLCGTLWTFLVQEIE